MKTQFFLLLMCIFFGLGAQAQCWQSIETGYNYSMAIKSDGTLWAWGSNDGGQLGDGTYTTRYHPVQIGSDADWQSLKIGPEGGHVLAYKTDGTLWAWGYNGVGQLGFESIFDTNIPIQIGSVADWQTVGVGAGHTVAIKPDGTIWAWGWNQYGQLGDGTLVDKHLPVQIGTDTDWQGVSCGYATTFAIKTNGTLWAWGLNDTGQLGVGIGANKKYPVQIGTDTDWQSLTAGKYHTLALKNDGSLWAWGDNYFGQLGDGTHTTRYYPTHIGSDTDWQSVTNGCETTLAIKNDGSRWGWGWNYNGQLGDGTDVDKDVPTLIDDASDWQSIAPNYFHTLFLKTDGTLWVSGENYLGALGTGTTNDEYTPVQVTPCPTSYIADDFCENANDINPLFGQSFNVPQVSVLYHNIGYTNTDSPTSGNECWEDGPASNHTIWYRFTGDGYTYRIRSIQCNSNNYNNDTQVAIYTGNCGNLSPVACNEDEDESSGDYNFKLELPTTVGLDYYLMVDGNQDKVGQFCLEVTNLSPTANTTVALTDNGLFPNPTNGIIQFRNIEPDLVKVFDSLGRLVNTVASPGHSIDLSKMPEGVYFLKLTEGKKVYAAKIVKE